MHCKDTILRTQNNWPYSKLIPNSGIDYKSGLIFLAAFILTWKFKIHPILMILLAGVAGILLYW